MATMDLYRVYYYNKESKGEKSFFCAVRPQEKYRQDGIEFIAKMVAEHGATKYSMCHIGAVRVANVTIVNDLAVDEDELGSTMP